MSRMPSVGRAFAVAVALLGGQAGCDSIFGIDDPVVVQADGGAGDASTDEPAEGPIGMDGGSSGSSSGASSSSGSSSGSGSGSGSGSSSGSSSGGDGGCTVANGCYVVPTGWTMVALRGDRNAACPAGTTQNDVDENPSVPASACACSCMVTGQPTCPQGVIDVKYDVGSMTCNMTGMPATLSSNGSCSTSGFYTGNIPGAGYSQIDTKLTPPGPTGGSCSSSVVTQQQDATATAERVCQPQSPPCSGNECTPSFPSPLQVCIAQSGNGSCPSGPFTQQHVVGTSVSFSCSSGCTCSTGATCTGTVELFTDASCGTGKLSLVADGACHGPATSMMQTYASWLYVPNPPTNVACTNVGSSSPQGVTLTNTETICCAP